MKKFASLILALALCMGLAVPAFAAELKSDKYTYTLSNEPVAAKRVFKEAQFDDDWNFIGVKEVTHTVYLVPAGTVVSAPAGRALAPVYRMEMEEFDDFAPGDYCDTLTIDEADCIYGIGSVSAETVEEGLFCAMEDEAIYLAVATSSNPAVPTQPTAYASTQNVLVNGKSIEFQCYALKDKNGNDTNYIKLRDVANVLNGTSAQFQVGWDGAVNIETGKRYTPTGSEMSTPFSGNRTYETATAKTRINGTAAALSAILLKDDSGNGYTYYKLRDLGTALGFKVDWTAQKGIFIETT